MADLDKANILDSLIYVKKEMPEVLYRDEILDGEPVAIIYDAVGKEMYHLKGNSGTIWKMIDGKRSLIAIAREISQTTGEKDENLILQDVIKFVVKLGRMNLIKFAHKRKNSEEHNYAAA